MTGCVLAVCLVAVTPQLPLTIAGTDDGLAVFANPAGLGPVTGFDLYYLYNFQRATLVQNSTIALNLGALAGYWEPGTGRYGVGLGLKQDEFLAGVRLARDSVFRWDIGALWRPASWIALGGVWQDWSHDWGAVSIGAALRPLGPRLTLFGEGFVDPVPRPVVGFRAEPVRGLELGLRVKVPLSGEELNWTLGLSLGLGRADVSAVRTHVPGEYGLCLHMGSQLRNALVPGRGKVLEICLDCPVVEQKPGFSLAGYGRCRTTWSLLELVKRATDDPSVRAIFLKLEGFEMSYPQAQEFRTMLARFRAKGKKVYVWARSYGMLDYYIASVADKIVGHPLSDVVIPGVALSSVFLKGTVEKLGIKFEYQRHGKYKSAVETFTEDSLTQENREQLQALVAALYEEFITTVSAGRHMSREELESLVEKGLFMADQAQAARLVDTLVYDDQLDSLLAQELRGLRRVNERRFRAEAKPKDGWQQLPRVAIVYAVGDIALGESHTDFLTGRMTMGANTIVRAIRQARNDRRVKAIVLRVDSPGGDGFAADLIGRELELARKKKPVVVSMAELAASGGYYIACPATKVFALPTTVTGSIGVFNMRLVTEGLYNKLGARRQVVKQGKHADMGQDIRELTAEEDSLLQAVVDRFYREFVQKVARGRNLTFEQVDSVAQGRVWAGVDARRVGIVDSLAGFMDAVEFAKNLAQLKECDYDFYPRPKLGTGRWLRQAAEEVLFQPRFQ